MAIQLLRKTDTAAFVARADDCANQDGTPAPHEAWLLADGQPKECDRFIIRALSAVEIAGDVSVMDAGRLGYVSGPLVWDELPPGWQMRVGALVSAVTFAPLAGPGSALTVPPATVPTATPGSPKSS